MIFVYVKGSDCVIGSGWKKMLNGGLMFGCFCYCFVICVYCN